ncbi:MAG: hypothetical protein KC593_08500 [Myxococcales bacterium]|nr:hypothetical protein [Myxococcales bacterium]
MSATTVRRGAFALLLLLAFVLSAPRAVHMPDVPLLMRSPAGCLALGVLLGAALLAFVARRFEAPAAALALVVLFAAAHAEMLGRRVEMASVTTVMSVAVFLGWALVAFWPAGPEARDQQRRLAHEVACGVFAATLFLAALAKLSNSGLSWVDGHRHAWLLLEKNIGHTDVIARARLWLAEHPTALTLAAGYALSVELAAPLFLFERLRKGYAVAVLLLAAGIALTLFFQPELFVLPVVLAWGGLDDRGDSAS